MENGFSNMRWLLTDWRQVPSERKRAGPRIENVQHHNQTLPLVLRHVNAEDPCQLQLECWVLTRIVLQILFRRGLCIRVILGCESPQLAHSG